MKLRDSQGILKGMFDAELSRNILRHLPGKWRPRHLKSGKTDTVYELTQSQTLNLPTPWGVMTMTFWEGDILEDN